jgi:chemosensory pili system protein ChpC
VSKTKGPSTPKQMRGMLLPLQDCQLLLPNTVVLEVVNYEQAEVEPIADVPDWLLGYQDWRQQRVPIIAFEVMLERASLKLSERPRLAICKTLGDNPERPFLAILLSSIPQLVQLTEDAIMPIKDEEDLGDLVQQQVLIGGQEAWIPDLSLLEWRLQEALSAG